MSRHFGQDRPPGPDAIARFVDRFGWRAYALPVLVLITLITLFRAGGGHGSAQAVVHQAAAHATATAPAAADPAKPTQPTNQASSTKPPTTKAPAAKAPATKASGSKGSGPKAPDLNAPARCHKNSSARKVVVSIAAQHAWMCARSALLYSSPVTTGASATGHSTPTGRFTVQGNVTNTTLNGPDYSVHVAYWIQFNGDIGFHDASWQTMKFGSADYPTQGSRGCVHMPRPAVAWLHKWVQVGRTVVVVTS